MRTIVKFILLLALAVPCLANTVYISQSGGTFSGGTACNGQSAQSLSFLQTSTNWVSSGPTGNQIGPGTTVYLCGTFTGTANATFSTAYQSGTSGSPILFQADSNTVITSPAWGTVFALNGQSYITFDGDSQAGIIQNTANGSSDNYANQVSTVVFSTHSTSHITIRFWAISNIYIHDSVSDATPSNPYPCGVCDSGSSSYLLMHDNIWHDMNFVNSAIADHLEEYNDQIYHVNHGVGGGDTTSTDVKIHDNWYHDFSNWDTTSDAYHLDPIHFYAANATGMNGVYIYNNYTSGNMGTNLNAMIYLESNGNNPGINNLYAFNNVFTTTNASASSGPGSGCWGMGNQNENHTFFNNTCVYPNTSGNNYAFWVTGGTTYVAKNNIFNCYQTQCMQVGPQYNPLSGVTFDYNDWYTTVGQAFCYGLSSEPCYSSFAAYQSASSQDAHSLGTQALLNSNGSEQSGSATIGAGTNLTSLCTTLSGLDSAVGTACLSDTSLGNTRVPVARPSSGAWDIGAYQYQSSQASAPTCTPGSGTYTATQTPACTNPNAGTTVQCYSISTTPATNGLGTACTTGTLLASGGTVSITTTGTVLQIIAGTSTLTDSTVNSYTYTLQGGTPTASPGPGTYTSTQTVTLTSPQGQSMVYTLDGSTPTSNGSGTITHGTAYTVPLTVSSTETIKAVGYASGFLDSAVGTFAYTITAASGISGQLSGGAISGGGLIH
jgi:Chitobiase/beta-hexosaminidase C-terminal domain